MKGNFILNKLLKNKKEILKNIVIFKLILKGLFKSF